MSSKVIWEVVLVELKLVYSEIVTEKKIMESLTRMNIGDILPMSTLSLSKYTDLNRHIMETLHEWGHCIQFELLEWARRDRFSINFESLIFIYRFEFPVLTADRKVDGASEAGVNALCFYAPIFKIFKLNWNNQKQLTHKSLNVTVLIEFQVAVTCAATENSGWSHDAMHASSRM